MSPKSLLNQPGAPVQPHFAPLQEAFCSLGPLLGEFSFLGKISLVRGFPIISCRPVRYSPNLKKLSVSVSGIFVTNSDNLKV